MSAYSNALHPPVPSHSQSGFSSLSGALARGTGGFASPFRRRVPQPIYTPSAKWQNTIRNPAQPYISFDYKGSTGQGIFMRDYCTRIPTADEIIGAHDAVFTGTGATRRIVFRVVWPGYDGTEWVRHLDIVIDNKPITRAQIAQKVALVVGRFLETHQNQPGIVSEFPIGYNGVRLENLVLVGLINTFADSWQADIAIDLR